MLKKVIVAAVILLAFAAGLYLGGRRPAVVHAQAPASPDTRTSLAPLPAAWGPVKGVLGRDQITLILEDEGGTIRAVTLESTTTNKGEPAVAPRVYAVVPRS